MGNRKIAVLIDSENTPHSKLNQIIEELSSFGQIIVKRAYGDFSAEQLKNWKQPLEAIRTKRTVPFIPPREGAAFWEQGHPRNLAVSCQKLYGSNKHWKKKYGYHKRSLSETAMFHVEKLLGGMLSLRNYNAQVGETYPMIKALNKLTGLSMPETIMIA